MDHLGHKLTAETGGWRKLHEQHVQAIQRQKGGGGEPG
jgi:hypothetical protein